MLFRSGSLALRALRLITLQKTPRRVRYDCMKLTIPTDFDTVSPYQKSLHCRCSTHQGRLLHHFSWAQKPTASLGTLMSRTQWPLVFSLQHLAIAGKSANWQYEEQPMTGVDRTRGQVCLRTPISALVSLTSAAATSASKELLLVF